MLTILKWFDAEPDTGRSAVTPPPGATVSYLVTLPNGTTVATTATSYSLGLLSLLGRYSVRTTISAGGWSSAPASIGVLLSLGSLLCL